MTRDQLFARLKTVGKKAGREVLIKALTLWYTMIDSATPTRVKALIFGDLVYFISPIDAIPDPLPGIGFGDDLGVMVATLALFAAHIKKEHHEAAKRTVEHWLA
ncbi:MAG: DUF1232 domain-containing protein [Bdellovibrionales bacterium]|nr:DUF1232 domain-containing protein [Bdellovibrionales bacterium]